MYNHDTLLTSLIRQMHRHNHHNYKQQHYLLYQQEIANQQIQL